MQGQDDNQHYAHDGWNSRTFLHDYLTRHLCLTLTVKITRLMLEIEGKCIDESCASQLNLKSDALITHHIVIIKVLEKDNLRYKHYGHQESSWRRERRLLGVMTGRGLYKSASS